MRSNQVSIGSGFGPEATAAEAIGDTDLNLGSQRAPDRDEVGRVEQ